MNSYHGKGFAKCIPGTATASSTAPSIPLSAMMLRMRSLSTGFEVFASWASQWCEHAQELFCCIHTTLKVFTHLEDWLSKLPPSNLNTNPRIQNTIIIHTQFVPHKSQSHGARKSHWDMHEIISLSNFCTERLGFCQ